MSTGRRCQSSHGSADCADIHYDELSSNKDDFTIIDVRNPGEIEHEGHIPGAHNVPLPELDDALKMSDDDFNSKYGFDKPKDGDSLVVHCQKGSRARRAGDKMANAGMSVRVYPGSFDDWKAKGGDVNPGKP
ncbi:rhodanese domain-containing protein CG4456-like isoform X1 [Macrobrachium rosenbergii]|uniref:rhodanese domain-containing protein CG4456-like isoform X1 n=1 Tax=Macrobrachium rosenbergii TaxID=79674 RepID=UPI0034D64629